jgi:RTX calcium-binding nonapeptide repeat (4 copies)
MDQMKRLTGILGVALCASLAAAPIAWGDAVVSNTGGTITATVTPQAAADGNHGIVVESFSDNTGRDGWRVRRDIAGRPPFSENDPECTVDAAATTVVCDGPRTQATVTGGDGDDTVVASQTPGGREGPNPIVQNLNLLSFSRTLTVPQLGPGFPCVPGAPPPGGTALVNLGAGSDFVAVVTTPLSPCNPGLVPEASFLAGLDADGGADRDGLFGGPVRDILDGGAGNDEVFGSGGNDNLTGGPDQDDLFGGNDDDVLQGNVGPDDLNGGNGLDTLDGSAGADALEGGPARDILLGGLDGDAIDARDGIADVINCGEGVTTGQDADLLTIDLFDPAPTSCERVRRFAIDDGPPAHPVGRRLRVRRGGRVAVSVLCPRDARKACRGLLTLLRPGSDRVLARARYRLRPAEKGSVSLVVGALPRRVVATTRERGVSRKGPRSSSALLRVSR